MSKRKRRSNNKLKKLLIYIIITITIGLIGYISNNIRIDNSTSEISNTNIVSFDIDSIPDYEESPYVIINNNRPSFDENDYTTKAFEKYSELDSLGRCGVAYTNVCKEIMPKEGEERESISNIKPSGWKTAKYEGIVEGNYLYNRCHLIGYQLSAENANEKNLITGTRYMNVEGMLPFENKIDDYIEQNENNHVLYRVTPIFKGNNLVASGLQLEAYSVEDEGKGICFNVYVYNVQPNIEIDYTNGESKVIK